MLYLPSIPSCARMIAINRRKRAPDPFAPQADFPIRRGFRFSTEGAEGAFSRLRSNDAVSA